jgi:hypothetical protein
MTATPNKKQYAAAHVRDAFVRGAMETQILLARRCSIPVGEVEAEALVRWPDPVSLVGRLRTWLSPDRGAAS